MKEKKKKKKRNGGGGGGEGGGGGGEMPFHVTLGLLWLARTTSAGPDLWGNSWTETRVYTAMNCRPTSVGVRRMHVHYLDRHPWGHPAETYSVPSILGSPFLYS